MRLGPIVLAIVVLVFVIVGVLMYDTVTNIRVYLDVYGLTSQAGRAPIALMKFVVVNDGVLPFSATYTISFAYTGLPTITKNFSVSLSSGQKEVFYFEVPALQSLQSVYITGHGIYNYGFKESFPNVIQYISTLEVRLEERSVTPKAEGYYMQEKVPSAPFSYSFMVTLSNETIYANGTIVYYLNVTFSPLSNGAIKVSLGSVLAVKLGNAIKTFTVVPGNSYSLVVPTITFPIDFRFNVTTVNGTLLGYGVYNVTS